MHFFPFMLHVLVVRSSVRECVDCVQSQVYFFVLSPLVHQIGKLIQYFEVIRVANYCNLNLKMNSHSSSLFLTEPLLISHTLQRSRLPTNESHTAFLFYFENVKKQVGVGDTKSRNMNMNMNSRQRSILCIRTSIALPSPTHTLLTTHILLTLPFTNNHQYYKINYVLEAGKHLAQSLIQEQSLLLPKSSMNRLIQKLKNAPKDVIEAATHKKEKKDKTMVIAMKCWSSLQRRGIRNQCFRRICARF